MIANALYLVALACVSPIVLYRMVRFGRYRRGISEKFLGLSAERAAELKGDAEQCVWFHAVSVGEVNLLESVIAKLSRARPDLAIVVSTSTDTGYDLAVGRFGKERVFFCPLDFTWAVRRTFNHLRPHRLVLAELELWPNLIGIARQSGCPVMVMNARLSERSAARYQRFGSLTKSMFKNLAWVGCQDQLGRERFMACGTMRDRVEVTGSIKFDDAPNSRETSEVQARQAWSGVDPWHRVWLFGSTQAGEEEIALDTYEQLREAHPELRLILVPRHPERFDSVAQLISSRGIKVHRRSQDKSMKDSQWESDRVILVDSIGELRHWWGVCQIATVGGSFGNRGGQNMLEPAGYGCAVSFGPNTRNFSEIADCLINSGGAVRVADQAELKQFVERCLIDVPAADALGIAAKEVIGQHRGASERTVAAIKNSFGASSELESAAA